MIFRTIFCPQRKKKHKMSKKGKKEMKRNKERKREKRGWTFFAEAERAVGVDLVLAQGRKSDLTILGLHLKKDN